jgi:ATP-dependent protease ClpP protease subunit
MLPITGELNDATIHKLLCTFVLQKICGPILVAVNSEGGNSDVYSTFLDCSRRHRRAGVLETLAVGEVYSGATVIVASGSAGKRYSYEHALWGMHEPYLPETTGDPAVLQSEIRMLQSTVDRFYSIIAELTKTSVATWRRRLKGQSMVSFDAKQALKWKLIDSIIY